MECASRNARKVPRRHAAADLARILHRHTGLLVDLVQQQVRERGLRALDLRGQHRLLAHEAVEQQRRVGQIARTNSSIARIVHFSYYGHMKTIPATEAKNRLGAILDAAQREPIVIRRQDRDIAVLLSMADYERLRSANVAALLELRDEVAAEAATAGLTEERLAEILSDDGA
jgi:prevent-host-death family protein